jgi:hypothetical protein
MKLIKTLAKEGLKFKKERKEKMDTAKPKTGKEAAKKRWWEKYNLGKDMGSNKKGVSKKSY